MNIFDWFKKKKPLKNVPRYFGQVVVVERISEVPNEIGNSVFLVRRERRDIWAVFMCPCGTNHRLTVNLSRNRRPFWRAKVKRGSFSLFPSIWLHEDCYSHFWVKDHRIFWA